MELYENHQYTIYSMTFMHALTNLHVLWSMWASQRCHLYAAKSSLILSVKVDVCYTGRLHNHHGLLAGFLFPCCRIMPTPSQNDHE